jgi:hypothetical protein
MSYINLPQGWKKRIDYSTFVSFIINLLKGIANYRDRESCVKTANFYYTNRSSFLQILIQGSPDFAVKGVTITEIPRKPDSIHINI